MVSRFNAPLRASGRKSAFDSPRGRILNTPKDTQRICSSLLKHTTFSNRFLIQVRFLKPATRRVSLINTTVFAGVRRATAAGTPLRSFWGTCARGSQRRRRWSLFQMLHYPALWSPRNELLVGFAWAAKAVRCRWRLPATPVSKVDNWDTCDIYREALMSVDQGERQIDSGDCTRRRPDDPSWTKIASNRPSP